MDLHSQVKLYVGTISGKGGVVPAVAMIVTPDDAPRDVAYFRVVFFIADEAVIIRGKVDEQSERGPDAFAGVADDPRGWEVHWRVKLAGETIVGEYFQPHDQGELHF